MSVGFYGSVPTEEERRINALIREVEDLRRRGDEDARIGRRWISVALGSLGLNIGLIVWMVMR